MEKDWKGNKKSTFVTLGASAHSEGEREEMDFYATEPNAAKLLLELETFNKNVWECACGEGHLSKVFKEYGHIVKSTDVVDRGYGSILDFLKNNTTFDGDIITNPPYKYAQEFVEKALSCVKDGAKVAMFLRIQFVEGKKRKEFIKNNPIKTIYVSSSRLQCGKNGVFEGSSAACYAWFIWQKGYNGETIIKWFN